MPEEQMRRVLKEMYAVSQEHWQLEADAMRVLDYLTTIGYRLGLISNAGDDEDVQNLIDRFSLRGYFQTILTSAALGWRKPHPKIFQEALSQAGYPREPGRDGGDMLGADILGAKNAGMQSVWITRRSDQRYANLSHEDTIQPEAVIRNPGRPAVRPAGTRKLQIERVISTPGTLAVRRGISKKQQPITICLSGFACRGRPIIGGCHGEEDKAVFFQDWPAHRAGIHREIAKAALARLCCPNRKQAGIKP